MINDVFFYDQGLIPIINVSKRWPGYPQTQTEDCIPIRFDPTSSKLEGYQNGSWGEIGSNVEVSVDPRLAKAVLWVEKRQEEEVNIEKILNKYPEIRKLKEQYEVMLILARNNDNESNS